LALVVLEWYLVAGLCQLRVVHPHSQPSILLVAVEAAKTLLIMPQLVALVVVVALLMAHQLVQPVTLVGILLLKVLLVVVMQPFKVARILRARAVAQAQRVKVLLEHQLAAMAAQEQPILFLVLP
jgi:hypothetical protein